MRILVLNGPNLNTLGRRNPEIYGSLTLQQILDELQRRANERGVELRCQQSNHEGGLIDFLQAEAGEADGIIVNAGALSHYGLSLRDALEDTGKPVVDVHISNIYRREPHRQHSIIAEVARGQITGLGWRGYLSALDLLVDLLTEGGSSITAPSAATRKSAQRERQA
ncbi:MAG TPA: type II 3-dehydroquinate dehydratase [Dehalococcoidia bacterium]|nr:type II 3-dehydroquinate dehydratase [Dehalococcoidia bacterium]